MSYRISLSLLSVFLLWLFFPDGPAPLLAFICLVPLGLALNGVNARCGLLLGMIYSFTAWLVSVWWISIGLVRWVDSSEPAAWFWTVVFCLVAALPYGLFGFLHGLCGWKPERLSDALRSATCLTLLIIWYPHILPGIYVHALFRFPLFTQVLDLGGVPLLLFLFNLINWLFICLVLRIRKRHAIVFPVISLALILSLMTGYGAYRLGEYHREMKSAHGEQCIQISSIQPNIEKMKKNAAVPQEKIVSLYKTMIELSERALDTYPGTELVAWPEVPRSIPCDCGDSKIQKVSAMVKKSGIPLIFSCISWGKGEHAEEYYNSAQMIHPTGTCGPLYRKRILLPFGEYLPFEKRFPFLRTIFPGVLRYVQGTETVLFEIPGGKRIIPTLCYEVVFSDLVREFTQAGGNVLLNLADDIWFGDSDASAIHLALGTYRSIEYRIPLVRVTNSGNGVFVQPTGEIVPGSRTPLSRQTVTSYPLFVPEKRSIYYRIGDLFLWILTIVWCIDAVVTTMRRRTAGMYKKDGTVS